MKYYFTFGSSKEFPFQNGYITVEGLSHRDIIRTFRASYPDRTDNVLNCADYYTEAQWDKFAGAYYKDDAPFEELKSELIEAPVIQTHDEILDVISKAVRVLDKNKEYGLGDRLLESLAQLQTEWSNPPETTLIAGLGDLSTEVYSETGEAACLSLYFKANGGDKALKLATAEVLERDGSLRLHAFLPHCKEAVDIFEYNFEAVKEACGVAREEVAS